MLTTTTLAIHHKIQLLLSTKFKANSDCEPYDLSTLCNFEYIFRNAYPNVLEMLDDSYSLLVRALEYHFRPRLRSRRPLAAANSQFRALPWSTDAEMAELYVAVATKDNVAVKVSLVKDP